jgi:hypothetical protein
MEINEQALNEALDLVAKTGNVPNLQEIVMETYRSLVKAERYGYSVGFSDGVSDEAQRIAGGFDQDDADDLRRAAAALDGEANDYFMYGQAGSDKFDIARAKGTGVEGEELVFVDEAR